MRPRQLPTEELRLLAGVQGGVLTAAQVGRAGLRRPAVARLLREGQWQMFERALYYAEPTHPPWSAWVWAGVLLGGPSARVGGMAAAFLGGLVPDEPPLVTVLVPFGEVHRSRQCWRFHRERPGVRGRSTGFPPRTTVADTVLDLCDGATVDQAVGWVTAAVQDRRTSVEQLREGLSHRSRARHRLLLTDLLTDVAAGAESPLEVRYLRDVERAHGLPTARRQQPSAALPFLRDALYEEFGLVVELDGRLGHDGMGRFRDMSRDNLTLATGRVTLRYGSADVYGTPCAVAVQVSGVLRQRGWTGTVARCPQCPSC